MSLTQAEMTELAMACYADPVLFLQTFLPEKFSDTVPWVHRGMLAIMLKRTDFLAKYGELDKIISHFVYTEDGKEKPMFSIDSVGNIHLVSKPKVAIMMPRGFSKTTLINGIILFLVVYQDKKFVLYVSETGNHSKMQLGNIKRELESNELLRMVFGNKVPTRQDSEQWSADMIVTLDGIVVIARGRGGQVRGLNYNANRPDIVVVDDLEDKESVSTAEQIKKTRSWFFRDLLPVLPRRDPNANIFVAGTLLSREALLLHLKKQLGWTFLEFGAIDRDGQLLWEAQMSQAQLDAEKQSFVTSGDLNGFYMEYMSELRNEESALFRQEFFRYDDNPEVVAKAIAIDPAISKSSRADSSTIAVVGMTAKGKLHVFECWGKRGATPREQIDKFFELIQIHQPTIYGVEAIAYQEALVHFMQEEMFRRKKYFEIKQIKHKTAKKARIKGILQPRYASGYTSHQRVFPELEQQLLDFTDDSAEHDDYPDVVAMAIALLDPFAAAAADGDDLAADEYKDIEDDLNGTFATAP